MIRSITSEVVERFNVSAVCYYSNSAALVIDGYAINIWICDGCFYARRVLSRAGCVLPLVSLDVDVVCACIRRFIAAPVVVEINDVI